MTPTECPKSHINIKIAEVFQNDEELHGYGFFTNITTSVSFLMVW